nr:MAG TPA: Large Terminase [Caudoviricetes sp.]
MTLQTSRDFLAIARDYRSSVATGKVKACKWVKLACKRQDDDLKRYARSGSYVWNETEAARICHFIELLTHTKGELAGQRVVLEPWQVFILTTVFGWRRRADGGRRFRRVYIEVPRGSGKSTLSSGVALYCLVADREPGAEVYSFATTRDQAKIVFGDAKVMAEHNEALKKKFGLEVLANSLYVPSTNSTFQAKSAEGSTLDGLNTHLAVVDELHAHKTRAVYDVVETSLGKRRSSLLWCITTAGFDTSGICYEVRTMCTKVLEKTTDDETQFAIIYTIDEGDDWSSMESLEKANPNWGVSVRPEVITSLLQKAKALPSAVNNFKTKHLDVWCSASAAWMDMDAWNRCESAGLDLSDYEGRPCFIGLDIGAKSDITAKVRLFPDGNSFAVFAEYYLPEAAIEKATNSQYSGWVAQELITATPGAMTNLAVVEDGIREDLSRFDVKAISYDPWNALALATSLSENGAPMVEYRNTVQMVSDPMKTLEALILDGRIRHTGDPVMRWMMSNVVAKLDAKDNIFPRKERYENKIDGVVALIYAIGLAGTPEEQDPFADIENCQADISIDY